MHATYSRPGMLFLGPAAVGLGLAAHLISGGAVPPLSVVVALTAVASLLATAAVHARRPPAWALGLGSGVLQQALHLLFTALAGPDGPLFPSSGHAHHGSPTPLPVPVQEGTSAAMDPHLLVVAHVAAALLTALLAIRATRTRPTPPPALPRPR
ncbi:hypothetical protein [Sinomonas humi]|uniref:hypothetical protein n=1 Tax=Sinomonas humi TaxID=1338436 RepID=UPI0012E0BF1F|nr:hypothetical protein [Sinomonas humi]